jgi:hypothetical protein
MLLNLYNNAKKIFKNPIIIGRVMIFLVFFLICFFIYKGYEYVLYKRDKKAFVPLFELLERYNRMVYSKNSLLINELAEDFESEFKKHKDSSLNQYFLAGKAGCLAISGDDNDKAILEFRNVIKNISNAPDICFIYKISLAMLLLNQENKNEQEEGLVLINNLSKNIKNPLHEMAIFYHGLFLLKTKSLKSADEIWAPLLNDPFYQESPYKNLINSARNWDF